MTQAFTLFYEKWASIFCPDILQTHVLKAFWLIFPTFVFFTVTSITELSQVTAIPEPESPEKVPHWGCTLIKSIFFPSLQNFLKSKGET